MGDPTPRWRYRHDNFTRALGLLGEAVDLMRSRDLSRLEKEGMIQRFEYTWELAWKTMKDLLESEGVALDLVTPARVVRAAAEARLVPDAAPWMEALDTRNLLAHGYSEATFDAAIVAIRERFLPTFAAFDTMLAGRRADA